MSKLFKNCYFISSALSAQNATSLRERQEKGKWFNFFISLLAVELLVHREAENYVLKAWRKPLHIPFCPHDKMYLKFWDPPPNERKLKFYQCWGSVNCHHLLYSGDIIEVRDFILIIIQFILFISLFTFSCKL